MHSFHHVHLNSVHDRVVLYVKDRPRFRVTREYLLRSCWYFNPTIQYSPSALHLYVQQGYLLLSRFTFEVHVIEDDPFVYLFIEVC